MDSAKEHFEIKAKYPYSFLTEHKGKAYLSWDLKRLIYCVNSLGGTPSFMSDMWVGVKTTGNVGYIEYSDEEIDSMPNDDAECERLFPEFKISFDIWSTATEFETCLKETIYQITKLYEKIGASLDWVSALKENNETAL